MGVTPRHLARMDLPVMVPTLVLLTRVLHPVLGVNTKAASFSVNCNCQCSDLTFRDKWGRVQGNCKAADNTGAVWCYVDSTHSSSCRDKVYSQRFSRQGKAWSYEACSTPSRYSSQCSGGFGGGGGEEFVEEATVEEDLEAVEDLEEVEDMEEGLDVAEGTVEEEDSVVEASLTVEGVRAM